MPKVDKNSKRTFAPSPTNPSPAPKSDQASEPMKAEEILSKVGGLCVELRKDVEDLKKESQEQRASLEALQSEFGIVKKKQDQQEPDEVVDAYCYRVGGDRSKPLSGPIEDFFLALQAGGGKVIKVKARRSKDGKLKALSPEEAAKYA